MTDVCKNLRKYAEKSDLEGFHKYITQLKLEQVFIIDN